MIVPLSTSNSSLENSSHSRAPGTRWGKSLVLAVLLFLCGVIGLEMFWRAQGHVPGLSDSMALWAKERAVIDAQGDNPNVVALIGASRIQLGVNTRVFHALYPNKTLSNLAIDGTSPMAVLRDLADNSDFQGLAIVSGRARDFEKIFWDDAQSHVDYYHKSYRPSMDRQWNVRLSLLLQSSLASLQQNLSTRSLIKAGVTRELPTPFYLATYPDRSRLADYSKMHDVEGHKAERIRRIESVAKTRTPKALIEWVQDVQKVNQWVQTIQKRGGRVIFVRFPTSDAHWDLDEARYPHAVYWNALAKNTTAQTLHFLDIKGVREIELPDTSHMDAADTKEFTTTLLRTIAGLGLLAPAP